VGHRQTRPHRPRDRPVMILSLMVSVWCRHLLPGARPQPAKAAAISSGVRVYSWAKLDNPSATRFLTPAGCALMRSRVCLQYD